MVADVDSKNIQYAEANVRWNSLNDRIKVCKTGLAGPLVPLDELDIGKYEISVSDTQC